MDKTIETPRGLVTIRPIREDDLAAFRELRLDALRLHPDAFSADYAQDQAKPMSFWEERIRQNTTGEAGILYVAASADQLLGMTGIYLESSPKTRHNGWIWGVYVGPEWRGLRLADELIGCCIDWGRAHGVVIAKLGVTTTNTPAIRCYTRLGFAVFGVEPKANSAGGDYHDELLMAKDV